MTDQIPMRSASERRDAAAKALARFDGRTEALGKSVETLYEHELAAALRPFLEVPEVGLTEDEIIDDVIAEFNRETGFYSPPAVMVGVRNWLRRGIRAAERAALEHWEPADVPSQEFMLRHLGIDARLARIKGDTARIFIPAQYIEKEVM